MVQKKSFDLIKEADTEKTKQLDCRWLRFLVLPSLVCFVLLLILINVDFSGTADSNSATIPYPTTDDTIFASTILPEKTKSNESAPSDSIKIPFSSSCQQVNNNKCKLNCKAFGIDRKSLDKELELQYQACKSPMDLTLSTSFESNTFKKADLSGNFELVNLTLENCILYKISDNAFDKATTTNLENLVILNSKLETITSKTFAGLYKIKFFKMINQPLSSKLQATNVFKPMAASLIEIVFQHSSAFLQEFDPGDWLQGADLVVLRKLELQGNYFTKKLKKTSFETLKRVEVLSLQLCYIETLADNTFDPIMSTLLYLDLSRNKLKVLSSHFLKNLPNSNVVLNLAANNWYCTCENIEFLEAVRNDEIQLVANGAPKCAEPKDLIGKEIKTIKICCEENEKESNEETTTTAISNNSPTISTTVTTVDDLGSDQPTTATTTENSSENYSTIELKCKIYLAENDPIKYDIRDQLAYFEIKTITSTSVRLTFMALPADARLLYFINPKDETFEYPKLSQTHLIVKQLIAEQNYVFCLMPFDAEPVSPFNCRAHHVSEGKLLEGIKPWLKSSDQKLFVTLTSIGVIIFLVIGGISMFFLLRCHPAFLCGNKRLMKLSPKSKKIFLKRNRSTLTIDEVYEALRIYAAGFQTDSNEYIKYYSSSELPSMKIQATNSPDNLPPLTRAPALPPICALRPLSVPSTASADVLANLEAIPEDFNEHEYQCLDELEGIYEITQ